MENSVRKREWVKTAAIIFLAVLLVLTFFSKTIMNASLPEVAAQQAASGAINARIRGSGTVEASEVYNVTIKQTRKVASVLVKTGQEINVGDTMFVLEAEDSDELKQAQTDLESMELNYEKSLIAASTEAARENREVQKLQETYNDLLAQYHQYSTMDAKKVELEKTKAEASLKELQKDLAKAQKELSSLQTDKEYTQAQADMTKYEAEVEQLEANVKELEEKYKALENGQSVAEQIQSMERQVKEQSALVAAKSNEVAELKKNKDYAALFTLSDDENNYMVIYVTDRPVLERKLIEILGMTSEEAATEATAMIAAYNAVAVAQNELDGLQAGLASLQQQLADLKTQQDSYTNKEKVKAELMKAQSDLQQADGKLGLAERTVKNFEADIKKAETGVEKIQDQVDAQQDVVDKLTNANTLASQVKSAKEALEDKIFEQSLSDGSSLDLEAAKKAIDEKKADIEKLTQNADETEVKAKVAGTVSNIAITAGSNANAETPLITLNLTDRGYTVKISVTNDQAKKVRVGDNAELVNYWYGGDIQATLENITNDPQNPGKGRLLVFRLTGDVEPDTNLTLSIGQKSANYDCIVPNSAVRTDSNGTFVLAITVKSSPLGNRYTATRVDVQELAKDDTNTAVTGLSSGDFVITTSTKPIEAGTQVRLVDNG
mgnify:FL=1